MQHKINLTLPKDMIELIKKPLVKEYNIFTSASAKSQTWDIWLWRKYS